MARFPAWQEHEVVSAKLIEFRFFDNAIGIEKERAVALDVKGLLPRRQLLFRLILEFDWHTNYTCSQVLSPTVRALPKECNK